MQRHTAATHSKTGQRRQLGARLVLGERAGVGVVAAVRVLPRVVGHKQQGVDHQAHAVVDGLQAARAGVAGQGEAGRQGGWAACSRRGRQAHGAGRGRSARRGCSGAASGGGMGTAPTVASASLAIPGRRQPPPVHTTHTCDSEKAWWPHSWPITCNVGGKAARGQAAAGEAWARQPRRCAHSLCPARGPACDCAALPHQPWRTQDPTAQSGGSARVRANRQHPPPPPPPMELTQQPVPTPPAKNQ